jgi:hypothetical protein
MAQFQCDAYPGVTGTPEGHFHYIECSATYITLRSLVLLVYLLFNYAVSIETMHLR